MLDRTAGIPLYHQLRSILLDEMRAGRLKPDDKLPTEDQLAELYSVSVITVRRTLSDLARAGYLRREQGRGTFVTRPTVTLGPRELTSFTREMSAHALHSTSRVLRRDVIRAGAELADSLHVIPGTEVFLLKRLRLADDEPMAIQTAHIPLALAPRIIDEEFNNASLYHILSRKYGIVPARAHEVHWATFIRGDDAAMLKAPEHSVGLAAMRTTFLPDGRPFEFVNSITRGDRYRIVLDLVSDPRQLRSRRR